LEPQTAVAVVAELVNQLVEVTMLAVQEAPALSLLGM
jgi:hypothetical protein